MRRFFVLAALCAIFAASVAMAADDFKLYNVDLNFTVDQAIQYGLDNNMEVWASQAPGKYRNNTSIGRIAPVYPDFKSLFRMFRDDFGIDNIPGEGDIEFVDKNLGTLAENGVFKFATVELQKGGKPHVTFLFSQAADGNFRCYKISFDTFIRGQYSNSEPGIFKASQEDFAKDVASVLEERYGNPKTIQLPQTERQPEPTDVQSAIAMLSPISNFTRMAEKGEQKKPAPYWRIGDQYALAERPGPMFVIPSAVSALFDDILRKLNSLVNEQENARKAKEESESRKRRSDM